MVESFLIVVTNVQFDLAGFFFFFFFLNTSSMRTALKGPEITGNEKIAMKILAFSLTLYLIDYEQLGVSICPSFYQHPSICT